MNTNSRFLSILAVMLAILSCNLPGSGVQATPGGTTPEQTATGPVPISQSNVTLTSSPVATDTTVPVATDTIAPAATACTANVVANSAVNVRSGPGTVYDIIGSLNQNGSATVAGKSADATWWYIDYPGVAGGHGWVSGTVVTPLCIPASLAVIAAPPTPLPPSGSCRDGFVFRLIRNSDKVCVSPASKAQADADNAAADSRKLISAYGADACAEGYVWREAFSGDHVCVTFAVRSQAAADNAAAASRWFVGTYGPHTCIAGFVWREATGNPSDDVCVEPSVKAQAANDNAAAASRKAINVYGADTCISGYVWREAFSSDHVCVTTGVKNQVAADNAAAPSHTWP